MRISFSNLWALVSIPVLIDRSFRRIVSGWVQRYDQESASYEIYTPIADVSKVNVLVLGTFDTPQEFPTVFNSLPV